MVGRESSKKYIKFINKNSEIIFLLFVFAIGLALRLLFINSREIAYDDAFSYFLSRGSFKTIISGTSVDTMPPLYYFLLHIWIKIGASLWFLRTLNILINLLTGLIVYFFTKELFGVFTSRIAIVLFMIAPFQIYHSQELRMYALLLLGQVGFYFSILKYIRSDFKNKRKWFIFVVLFGVIAMYSHNLGILGLLGVNLIFFFLREKKEFLKILLIQFFILIFSLPWLFYLPQQIEKVQNAFWTAKPGIIDIVQGLMTLFSFLPMPTLITGFSLVVIFQSFIFITWNIIKTKSKLPFAIFLIFLFIPTLLFVISYIVQPVFVPRIFILSSAWFFILLAHFITTQWNSHIGKINLGLFILMSVLSLPYYYQFNSFPRSPYKELAHFLHGIEGDNIIVHDNKLSFFPVMFYDETDNSFYLKDRDGSPNDTLAVKSQEALGYLASGSINEFMNEENVVFITFQETINEYNEMKQENPNLSPLINKFQSYKMKEIGDLVIFEFGEFK